MAKKKKTGITTDKNGVMNVIVDKNTFGILDDDIARRLFEQVVSSTMGYYSMYDKEYLAKYQNAAVSMFHALKPQNEIEGMLGCQIVANHFAVMKSYDRASISDQPPEFRDMYLKHAAKLSRIYIEQVTALNKMRGKSQQKVRVEHIHIYEGGQAIVGNVNSEGGGAEKNASNKPHALTNAPEQAMRSLDQKAEQVPVTSNEER